MAAHRIADEPSAVCPRLCLDRREPARERACSGLARVEPVAHELYELPALGAAIRSRLGKDQIAHERERIGVEPLLAFRIAGFSDGRQDLFEREGVEPRKRRTPLRRDSTD